jgi:hypothetical protein
MSAFKPDEISLLKPIPPYKPIDILSYISSSFYQLSSLSSSSSLPSSLSLTNFHSFSSGSCIQFSISQLLRWSGRHGALHLWLVRDFLDSVMRLSDHQRDIQTIQVTIHLYLISSSSIIFISSFGCKYLNRSICMFDVLCSFVLVLF